MMAIVPSVQLPAGSSGATSGWVIQARNVTATTAITRFWGAPSGVSSAMVARAALTSKGWAATFWTLAMIYAATGTPIMTIGRP